MNLSSKRTDKRFHLVGWLLFLVCAIFFIAQSLSGSSIMGLIGSVIFLLGCIAFIVPLLQRWHEEEQ
jgi:predicted membrane channel-forming protein YqfA (hemolysin III family)